MNLLSILNCDTVIAVHNFASIISDPPRPIIGIQNVRLHSAVDGFSFQFVF